MAERTQVGLGLAQHQPQPQLASCFPALEGFLQWSRQRKYLSYQISGLKKDSIPHCLGALVPCQAGPAFSALPPSLGPLMGNQPRLHTWVLTPPSDVC